MYSTPISEMGFSTRTYNVLTHLGVQDIFGLSKLDETTLHHAQNSGKKTVHEVMEFKEQFNLKMLSDPDIHAVCRMAGTQVVGTGT